MFLLTILMNWYMAETSIAESCPFPHGAKSASTL